jgi:hypothetical protein
VTALASTIETEPSGTPRLTAAQLATRSSGCCNAGSPAGKTARAAARLSRELDGPFTARRKSLKIPIRRLGAIRAYSPSSEPRKFIKHRNVNQWLIASKPTKDMTVFRLSRRMNP